MADQTELTEDNEDKAPLTPNDQAPTDGKSPTESATATPVIDKIQSLQCPEHTNIFTVPLGVLQGPKGSDDFFKRPDHIKTSATLQNDTEYRIDPERHCSIFRGYIRQDWDTANIEHGLEELRAGWIDLLFDLIFVACVVHVSIEAAYSLPSDHGDGHRRLASSATSDDDCHSGKYDVLLMCFAQFGLLSLFWMEQTMIDTHFVFNQTMDEVLQLIYMIFVLSTGLFIQNDVLYHVAFQISYLCLRLVSCLIYFKAYLIPRAKSHALWNIVVNGIVILSLLIISIIFRGCAINYFGIYLGFFFFEYITFIIHLNIKNRNYALAMHVAHISERFGLFVMLILGESIISIMTTNIGTFSWKGIVNIMFIIATFLMSYFIAKLYFDCQPSEEAIMHGKDNHALRTSARTRILYICCHHVLFFGLLGFGVGTKIAFKHRTDDIDKREYIDVMLPGYSLCIIVISLNVIRMAHPNKKKTKLNIWMLRGILLVIMCIMPIFAIQINQAIIFFVDFICVLGLILVDVEGRRNRKLLKKEMKEKREHEKEKAKHVGLKNIRYLMNSQPNNDAYSANNHDE